MDRYLCIHGHFYQPPRENPWLEAIELQESAYPYHDWNERITDECYAPNARSRILDGEGRIVRITNNYARMSFNFGPTLLSWMKDSRPDVYQDILDADKESVARFGGHGSAMAQGYGHIILPLSNERDKRTQVLWGVRDFERRFGRRPEGMWLPECAVDTPTLEAVAAAGIRFTVLAPRQAAAFRRMGEEHWAEAAGSVDPSRAYLCRLPSGGEISLFFYDGPVSQAVAFERLLESGEKFASRLLGAFDDARQGPQLVHIATDGETYGHHHRHGDMALAYAFEHVEANGLARIINYGQFLELHPPLFEARIVENSSWSCVHGVERWKSDCGCSSGRPGWHQRWRDPLRRALDWLRDTLAPLFERAARPLLRDPWAARDGYIDVILDRSPDSLERFFAAHGAGPLPEADRVRALKLLEMQRQCMLMYTSCGWFFDELSGLETVQVQQYAGRAMQLAAETLDADLEGEFERLVEAAPTNVPERPDGRAVYEQCVRPAVVDLRKVAAHYAISSLFTDGPPARRVYAFDVDPVDARPAAAGRARLAVGRARFRSRVTGEAEEVTYGVLHLGDHVVSAGVRPFTGPEAYERLAAAASGAFGRAEYADVIRVLDAEFGGTTYSLRSLFRDEQGRAVGRILGGALREVEAAQGQVYEHHAPLLRFLESNGIAAPRELMATAEFVLNARLRRAMEEPRPDAEALRGTLREAREQGVSLDRDLLGFTAFINLRRVALRDLDPEPSLEALVGLSELVRVTRELPFETNLAPVQNLYYPLLERQRAAGEAAHDAAWRDAFLGLGRLLGVRVD